MGITSVAAPPDLVRLVDRVRAGSAEALEMLYRAYAADVHRTAFCLLRSRADAEDVVQEVFLGLPRALRGYRGEGSFEGWLRRVAARTALMRIRSAGRRREDGIASLATRTSPATGEPADRITLERALASLAEPLRLVFTLKVVEGYGHEEIAALLGITAEASRARLARARKQLRKHLS